MKKLGFIGTGVMGTSIVKHLLKAGCTVYVYNRTKAHAEAALAAGALWSATPQEVTEKSDVIFTMVGFPTDVRAVYFGDQGIFQAPIAGKFLVDLTTSEPTLARELFEHALKEGAYALDAPVSGGDLGAQNGTLTIMVGGESEPFAELKPLFELFGTTVQLQGGAGSGQHTKMANQIMIAGTMTGMCELLAYADKAGLNLEKVVATVNGGSAANWSLANYAPRILQHDFTPGFFVKHFIKDLRIALEEAEKMGLELPATQEAKRLYDALAAKGEENAGTQALIKLWWPAGDPAVYHKKS